MECGRGLEAVINLSKMIDYGARHWIIFYWQRCKHVELEQFWHAFASRGFVSDSWAFLALYVSYRNDELHWLDVPERIGVTVYRCLHGRTFRYFADYLIPTSDAHRRRSLRYANQNRLTVSRCRRTAVGLFYHTGLTEWNLLPDELRNFLTFLIVLNDSWKQFFNSFQSVSVTYSHRTGRIYRWRTFPTHHAQPVPWCFT